MGSPRVSVNNVVNYINESIAPVAMTSSLFQPMCCTNVLHTVLADTNHYGTQSSYSWLAKPHIYWKAHGDSTYTVSSCLPHAQNHQMNLLTIEMLNMF